jgi:hypothetical protein
MSVISRMRKQNALYWEAISLEPDRYGQFTYEAPVMITCRWDDVNELSLKPDGTEFTTQSKVYVESVDTKPGDYLRQTDTAVEVDEIALLTSETIPQNNEDTHRIEAVDKNPNFKGTETLVTAKL